MTVKTLTAQMAKKLRDNIIDYWERKEGTYGWSHPPLDAIAAGAHEVIDRATHRAVSVETLRISAYG